MSVSILKFLTLTSFLCLCNLWTFTSFIFEKTFFFCNFKVTQKLNGGLLRSNKVNWNLFQDIFEKQFNYCVIPKNIKPTKIKLRINFVDRISGLDRPWWNGPVVIFDSNDRPLLTCIVCCIDRTDSLRFKQIEWSCVQIVDEIQVCPLPANFD